LHREVYFEILLPMYGDLYLDLLWNLYAIEFLLQKFLYDKIFIMWKIWNVTFLWPDTTTRKIL